MLVRGSCPWRAGCGLLWAACLLLQVRVSSAQAPTPTDFISQRIEQLGSPDPVVRTQAADDLWHLSNDPRAIEPLLVNLKDQNRQLSRFAGMALARIGSPAVPSLLELLHDPDAQMRLKALAAIDTIQDSRVMPAIEAALQDENPNVRDVAMQAIAQYGDEAREKVLVNLLAHAPQKEWFHDESAFNSAGPAAIAPLMELLSNGQAEDRLRAAMALSHVGFSSPGLFRDDPSVVDTWINGWRPVLKDPNAHLRSDAVEALRETRDPRVVPDLLQLRMDPDPEVRSAAIRSLEDFREDARVIEFFGGHLRDPDPAVRMEAAWVLSMNGDPRALEPLLQGLTSKSSNARNSAATALGMGKYREGVAPLIELLNDSVLDVRASAAESLGEIGDVRAAAPLTAALIRDLDDSTVSPGGISSAMVLRRQGREQFDDAVRRLRQKEITALGKLHDPSATLAVARALNDPMLTRDASEALGAIGDPRAVTPLLAVLRTEKWAQYDSDVPKALGKLGPGAVGPLTAALKDPNATIRSAAAVGLGAIGNPRSREPLLLLLHDPDVDVRRNAVYGLGMMKDPRVVKPLILLLGDPTVAWEAALGLGQMADPPIRPLLAALDSPDGMVRRNAAEALALTNDPRARAALLRKLDERDAEAIVGAYTFYIEEGKPGSEDALIEALDRAGDEPMARALVNCGNERLAMATRGWVPGKDPQMRPNEIGARWGQRPESDHFQATGK